MEQDIIWLVYSYHIRIPVVPRVAIFTVCFLFAASAWNKKWNNPNENIKYEHGMWSRMLYRTIDFVLFACTRPHGSQGLAPGLSLPIILTLLNSHLSKIFGNGKKKPTKTIFFFKKLLWSHFWINFNIFYTKTFGIVYILFLYLLIMFIWVVFICT
jgi:hypothetical protein